MPHIQDDSSLQAPMSHTWYLLIFNSTYNGMSVTENYLIELEDVYNFFINLSMEENLIRHSLTDEDDITFYNAARYVECFTAIRLAQFQVDVFKDSGMKRAREDENIKSYF